MAYRDEVLADSPIVYWRLGESSGVAAEDESGNDNDGTYVNDPGLGATGLLTGDADTAVDLDGVDEHIIADSVIGDWSTFAQAGQRIIEFWIQTTESGVSRIMGTANDGSSVFLQLFTNTNHAGSNVAGNTAYRTRSDTNVVNACSWDQAEVDIYDGQPHHVVIVQRGDSATFWDVYVDGAEISITVTSNTTGSSTDWGYPLVIGALNNRGTIQSFFEGRIDEIAFYVGSLSAARILAHYEAGTEAPNDPPDTPTLTVDEAREDEADLSGSAFSDPDGDNHAASQWQVDVAGGDFSTPVFDSGRDVTNLLSITATGLTAETDYIARVRYEDDGSGSFSEWSTEVSFTTAEAPVWGDCEEPTVVVWPSCEEPTGGAITGINQTDTGLIFRDQFNRANDPDVGNGWTKTTGGGIGDLDLLELIDNQLKKEAGTAVGVMRDISGFDTEKNILIQGNIRAGSDPHGLTLWAKGSGGISSPLPNGYLIDTRDLGFGEQNEWLLRRATDEITVDLFSQTANPNFGEGSIFSLRGTVIGTQLSLYVANVSGLTDIDNDFSLIGQVEDPSPPPLGGIFGIRIRHSVGQADEFMLCGTHVTVTGLPTGWKAQVDSRTAVEETGGTVSMNVSTWALPMGTLKILDPDGVEQFTDTPGIGLWGGANYEAEGSSGFTACAEPTAAAWSDC